MLALDISLYSIALYTCVIIRTLMLALDMAAMKRIATPGTPMSDAPSRLTMDTLSIDVMPLIGITGAFDDKALSVMPI